MGPTELRANAEARARNRTTEAAAAEGGLPLRTDPLAMQARHVDQELLRHVTEREQQRRGRLPRAAEHDGTADTVYVDGALYVDNVLVMGRCTYAFNKRQLREQLGLPEWDMYREPNESIARGEASAQRHVRARTESSAAQAMVDLGTGGISDLSDPESEDARIAAVVAAAGAAVHGSSSSQTAHAPPAAAAAASGSSGRRTNGPLSDEQLAACRGMTDGHAQVIDGEHVDSMMLIT